MNTTHSIPMNLKAAILVLGLAIPSIAGAADPVWTLRGSGTSWNLYGVATSGSTTIAVGQYGTYRVSADNGATWSGASAGGDLRAITWTTGSSFVAVGGSQCAYTTNNGGNWTTAPTTAGANSASLNGVCHRGGTIVGVGDSGTIKTSSDGGATWTLRTSNTTEVLRGVAAGPSSFVAVGDNGAVCRSMDGTAWVAATVPPYGGPYTSTNDFVAVTWAGSQFVVVGGDASTQAQWTSPDGITWTYGRGLEARYAVAWTGSHVIVGGNKFGWWQPADLPASWQQAGRPTNNQIQGLAATSGGTIIAVSLSGGIATTPATLPAPSITLSLSADPAAGGSVSGAGSYPAGSSVSANATANSGYSFTNWTESGTVVSSSANYTFTLSASRSLVANFAVATPTRIISLSGSMAFGNVTVGETAQRILKISNTGNTALIVTGLVYPAGFSAPWHGTIPAGGSQDVVVTFSPTAAKAYSGTITVNSDATTGTKTTTATGTGIAAPTKIIALSGSLAFGNVGVGASPQRTLTIKNTGNTPLSVHGIMYPAGFGGDWNGIISAGGSQDVAVTFTPSAVQPYGGSVTVDSDATSGNGTTTASGSGLAATRIIALSGSLAFGTVAVVSSAQKTLKISNTGNCPLTITAVEYPAGFSGTWSGSIPPRSSQNVTVTFSPSQAKPYGGTIFVQCNETSGTKSADISGAGLIADRVAAGSNVDLAVPRSVTGTVKSVTGLPPGLKYDPQTGRITGRPTAPGTSTYTVKASGADGKMESFTFAIVVDALQVWATGSFTSLLAPPSPANATLPGRGGYLKLTSTSGSSFTGSLILESESFAFCGQIDGVLESARGNAPLLAQVTISTVAKDPAQDIVLMLEFRPESAPATPGLTGTLSYNGTTLPLGPGWQHVWNAKTNPAFGNKDRVLNVALRTTGAAGPQGIGFATIKLNTAGQVTWAATVADGLKAAGSFTASPEGDLPLYAPIAYPGGGSVGALLATESVGDFLRVVNNPSATGRWVKLATAEKKTDRLYRSGFDVGLQISGAEFLKPAAGQLLFGNPAPPLPLGFDMSKAGIDQAIGLAPFVTAGVVQLDGELRTGNKVVVTSIIQNKPIKPPGFSTATGLLNGSFKLSDTVANKAISRTVPFCGLYIPDLNTPGHSTIAGFFLLPQLPAAGESAAKTPIESGPSEISP